MKNSSSSYRSVRLNTKYCAHAFSKTFLLLLLLLFYLRPTAYEKEGTALLLYMLLVLILLGSRIPSSADIKKERICTSNSTCAMMSCKKPKLIHKHKFDFLKLDIHVIYTKCLKSTFHPNIRYTQYFIQHIPQHLFHVYKNQLSNNGGEKIAVWFENYTRNIHKTEV